MAVIDKTGDKMDLSECGYSTLQQEGVGGVGRYSIIMSKTTGNKYVLKSYGSLPEITKSPFRDLGMTAVRELDMYFRLEHPNILHGIKFMTPRICRQIQGQFGIFLPLTEGSLLKLLSTFSVEQKLQVCHDIASAMAFLHDMDMIFPALNLEYIYIDSNKRAVIGGSDEICYCNYGDSVSDEEVDVPLWMLSPSDSETNSRFSWKGDVWRVGMLILWIMNNSFRPNMNITGRRELNNFHARFESEENRRAYLKNVVEGMVPKGADSVLTAKIGGMLTTLVKMMNTEVPISMRRAVGELSDSLMLKAAIGKELVAQQKQVDIPSFVSDVFQVTMSDLEIDRRSPFTMEHALLTMDLYMRAVPYYEPLKGDEKYDTRNYALLVGVCARLASKLVYGFVNVSNTDVVNTSSFTDAKAAFGSATSIDIVLRLNSIESSLIEMFQGVLYRRHLFHVCRDSDDLFLAYKEVTNPKYLYIDSKTWGKSGERNFGLKDVLFFDTVSAKIGNSLLFKR